MAARADLFADRISPSDKLAAYDIGITPDQAVSRVARAASDADGQRRLFDTMISRDGDLGNAVDQRCLALAGARWRFEPREGVEEEEAAPVLARLPNETLRQLVLEHCALFRLYGYGLVEIEREPDWTVKRLLPVPYGATAARQGTLYLRLESGGELAVTDPETAIRLLVLRASESDPASAARLRRCVGLWVTKAFLARDWRMYLERFGTPTWDAKYDPDKPPLSTDPGKTPEQTIVEALEDMRAHGIVAHAKTVELALLTDQRGTATMSFEAFWDRCNAGIYRAILGQQSTSQAGDVGARAADEVRERTLDALVEADARVIAEEMTEQVIWPTEDAIAGSRRLVQVGYSWEREAPQLQRATIMEIAANIGIAFDEDAARDELGLSAPTEEQAAARRERADFEAELAKAQARAQQPPAVPEPGLAARVRRALDALRGIEPARTFRAGTGTMHQALDAIGRASKLKTAIERNTMAELRAKLRPDMTPEQADHLIGELLTARNLKPIAERVEAALLAARINGRLLAVAQRDRLARRRK